MARVAIGGFQHETNTFAPTRADYAAFEAGGGWPGAQYGAPIFATVEGANIPAAGAIQALRSLGHELVGTAWAAASPSAQVTDDAFERVMKEMISRIQAALPLDAVYLDLHGAMVTESHGDGESEILRRVREAVGPRVPVVASLDLHANVTDAMVKHADAMVAYRTYPHIDMADTGARAARLLDQILRAGRRPAGSWLQLDYLTGIPSQCSFIEPCKSIYEELSRMESKHDVVLSFTPGFAMADFEDCGMSVFGFGAEQKQANKAVEQLRRTVADAEKDFAMELHSPGDAVRRARERGEPGKPVVLADTQDNPGAGGNGDTTGLLKALIDQGTRGAVPGLLLHPASAPRAPAARGDSALRFSLGGKSNIRGGSPLRGEFTVKRLG